MNHRAHVYYDFIPQIRAVAGVFPQRDPNSDFIMALGADWPTKPEVIGGGLADRRRRRQFRCTVSKNESGTV